MRTSRMYKMEEVFCSNKSIDFYKTNENKEVSKGVEKREKEGERERRKDRKEERKKDKGIFITIKKIWNKN